MIKYLIILSYALFPAVALAHPGHEASGWVGGFFHPFSGLDHMLAMLALGIWVAMRQRSMILAGSIFLSGMLLGGLLGMLLQSAPPQFETLVLGSSLLAALMVMFAVRMPQLSQWLMTGLFAVIHGMAHGLEQPASVSVHSYAAGFLLASAVLLFAGWVAGKVTGVERRQQALGAGLAAVAGVLFFAG